MTAFYYIASCFNAHALFRYLDFFLTKQPNKYLACLQAWGLLAVFAVLILSHSKEMVPGKPLLISFITMNPEVRRLVLL